MMAVVIIAMMTVAIFLAVAAVVTALDAFFTGTVFAVILAGVQESLEGGLLLHRGGWLGHEWACSSGGNKGEYNAMCIHDEGIKRMDSMGPASVQKQGTQKRREVKAIFSFWIARGDENC